MWEDKEGKCKDQTESASVDSNLQSLAMEGKGWAQNDSFISLIENRHGFLYILYSSHLKRK